MLRRLVEGGPVTNYHPVTVEAVARIRAPGAVDDVASYFNSGRFTGGQFERFAGGGDRGAAANLIDSDDIVAVSLLSVPIPGRALLEILGDRSARLSELLAEVPTDRDLWEVGDDVIGSSSPVSQAWSLLMEVPGVGWVRAGKLLPRKRPRLIPVYDRVVKTALARPDGGGFWCALRDLLRDAPGVRDRLAEIRTEAVVGEDISLLRVLDVVLWMHGAGHPEAIPSEAEGEHGTP